MRPYTSRSGHKNSEPGADRTRDARLKRPVLYHLSYRLASFDYFTRKKNLCQAIDF